MLRPIFNERDMKRVKESEKVRAWGQNRDDKVQRYGYFDCRHVENPARLTITSTMYLTFSSSCMNRYPSYNFPYLQFFLIYNFSMFEFSHTNFPRRIK